MGRTSCTEPQFLYNDAINLFIIIIIIHLCNSITSADAKKLEYIQWKFVVPVKTVALLMTMSHTRIFVHFYSAITRTTEDFIVMQYFLFLFIQVKTVASLFWVLPVF